MSVMEEMTNFASAAKEWYESLSEDKKSNSVVYLIMGDMEGKYNVDFIAGGSMEKLVMAVAQSMADDRDFYTVAKAAVSLVDSYNKTVMEEVAANMGKPNEKIVS